MQGISKMIDVNVFLVEVIAMAAIGIVSIRMIFFGFGFTFFGAGSKRFFSLFFGSNAIHLLDFRDEDLSVTDFPGVGILKKAFH